MGRKTQQIRVRGTPKQFHAGQQELKIQPFPDNMFYDKLRNLYIKVIDYDNHMVGLNPDFARGKKNAWFGICSCGMPAIVTGYNAYKHGASAATGGKEIAQGELIVCSHHIQYGVHGDGSS